MMRLSVGTLRAASALFTVVGSRVQRANGVVSVILWTQHAASLHPNMPTCSHAHMLCFCSLLYEVYPLLYPLRLGKF